MRLLSRLRCHMNSQLLNNEEVQRIDDLNWLSQRAKAVTDTQKLYFCDTVKDALARGWALVYARHYALGKLMGVHWIVRERPVGLKPLYGASTISAS